MTLFARQPVRDGVLVMTGGTVAGKGDMLRVIELHRGIDILNAVKDAYSGGLRRSAHVGRGEKTKTQD